jgi:hypothetical protein
MTIRSLMFATTILAASTGVAFAQSATGDFNNSATGTRDSVQTPPAQKQMKKDQERSGAAVKGTTGYGGQKSPAQQSQEKTESPASQGQGSGIEKDK